MSEWNLLGRSDSDRKPKTCDRERMVIGHQKTALAARFLVFEVSVIS